MISTDTSLWEDILLAIEEGQVVPIVGRDLLVIDTEAGPRLFHHMVAERLAADPELKISISHLPAEFDTNDVICAYERFHGDSTGFNPKVVRIVRDLKLTVPEPLRLLAEIPRFNLFVSTSFDNLLEQAIFAVRGRKPSIVAFPPASNLTDFDEDLLNQSGALVFQILGRLSASSAFALTEGQMLEQMHDFMSGPRRPHKLINRLTESHLLFLGVSFPDWLARFLLRVARAKPLWDSRQMMEIIADCGRPAQDFALFLHRFSPQQSRLFTEGPPVQFVRELHRRWFERNPTSLSDGDAGRSCEKPSDMAPGSIFISYASEDQQEAFHLADDLNNAGLEVWVDRRLNPGDDYNNIIERFIRECCAFIPVLSSHTQSDEERWFRKEWELGRERARRFFGTDRPFLFPVVVDETPNSELVEFRRELFSRTAVRALHGIAPPDLISQLDATQKGWRKSRI